MSPGTSRKSRGCDGAAPPESARDSLAGLRAQLLVQAGETLAASLDYATTLQAVAALAVGGFADACLVDIVNDDGTAERLAVGDGGEAADEVEPRTLTLTAHGDRWKEWVDAAGN